MAQFQYWVFDDEIGGFWFGQISHNCAIFTYFFICAIFTYNPV